MVQSVGFFLMLVGFVTVWVGGDYRLPWRSESNEMKEDHRYDDILREMTELKKLCSPERVIGAVERLDSKYQALEIALKNQKPPVIQMPQKMGVEVLTPVEIKGDLGVSTPNGQSVKILHRQARKKKLTEVKKQIEALSK